MPQPRQLERAVITGVGVASAVGCKIDEFWEGLLAGRSGITSLGEEFAHLPSTIGGRVADFDESRYYSVKEARRMSRSAKLGLVAASEAIDSANLCSSEVDRSEVGVIVSSSIGGFAASDFYFKDYYVNNRLSPLIIPVSMNVGPASNISIRYGFQGPLMSVDAACASAAHSISHAFMLIQTGVLSIAVAGGADSPLSPGVVAAWSALCALSKRNDCPETACRPFSADRDGMVLGEGAGILVLESETSARQRNQPILAEVKGFGSSGDSYHLTQPKQEGPVKAMLRSLKCAQLEATEIDYINAHGTGTRYNDSNETAAIKEVFGHHAYAIPVVANKAALGHSIAASAGIELVGCVLSLRDQVVPPTINYSMAEPECDLDYVIHGKRNLSLRHIMSNSFAFGGSNVSLIISRYEPSNPM